MLRNLLIQNYALLDRLDLSFEPGLSIVTGETGAGKSILLGALSLLLGQRSDSTALLDKSRKCILEASFEVDEGRFLPWVTTRDLDWQQPMVLRREISPDGKSRAFINDTPVNLAVLKEAGAFLVDIHSQHETLLLNRSDFQLSVVDAFAGTRQQSEAFRKAHAAYQQVSTALEESLEAEKKSAADAAYYQFQAEELDAAALVEDEQERHETELAALTHAEEIKSGLAKAAAVTAEADDSLLSRISELYQALQVPARYHPPAAVLRDRVKSAQIEIQDIGAELEQAGEAIHFSAARMEWLNERLDVLQRLQQKHRVSTVKELLGVRDDFYDKLARVKSLEDSVRDLETQCAIQRSDLSVRAAELTRLRNAAIPNLEREMKKLLKEVALPHAVLKVENEELPEFAASGCDRIRFLFSANKGVVHQEISRVASGGELSRLMLCLKSLMAGLADLPVMIFDEIDSGISGETAVRVGRMLKEMAGKHQVLAITHLPQIAGRGAHHYYVYKETGKKTTTHVRRLSHEERIVEVARMLSGEKPTAIALENARELLQMH